MGELLYKDLTGKIRQAAYEVHKYFGNGFLEKVYENALVHELRKRGLQVLQQVAIKVHYDGIVVGEYFADVLVAGKVIVELKAAEAIADGYKAQLINYLKGWGKRLGYKRVPYDPVQGMVLHAGKWVELTQRVSVSCERVSVAVDALLQQHGFGYGVNVYKKLLMAELEYLGSTAVFPVFSPSYGALNLGSREIGSILVDSCLLVSVSASGRGASSIELACLKSYMRQTATPNGLLIDIGCPEIQLKGVL